MTERDLLQNLLDDFPNTWYVRGLGWYTEEPGGFMVHIPEETLSKSLLERCFKSDRELYHTVTINRRNISAAIDLLKMVRTRSDIQPGAFYFQNETPSKPFFSRITIPLQECDTTPCQDWAESVYAENPDLIQEVGGYCIFSPDNRHQKVFLVTGPGGNGKGTFLRILTTILESKVEGSRLSSPIDLDDMGKHERVTLLGKQLVYDADISGSKHALRWLKVISGGDSITGRHLYKEQVEFLPTCKLMLLSNPIPDWDNSPALVRRIVLLHFTKRFDLDPHFEDRLMRNEMLLKWVWYFREGYTRVCNQGFSLTSKNNPAEFLSHSDDMSYFLQEYCQLGINETIPTDALYEQFKRYWKAELEETKPPVNKRVFGKRLREYGIEKQRNKTLSENELEQYELIDIAEKKEKERWDIYRGISVRRWLQDERRSVNDRRKDGHD